MSNLRTAGGGLFGLGLAYTEARKRAAWKKAFPIAGFDQNERRQDAYGILIDWADYGSRNSAFGWEIDHATPVALGGGDGFDNLRALHWRNNARLGGALSGLLR